MGWFSKSTDGFFLSTTTPPDIPRSQYLGVVVQRKNCLLYTSPSPRD